VLGGINVTFEHLEKGMGALRGVSREEEISQASREALPFVLYLKD
jgi:hypothetical protein